MGNKYFLFQLEDNNNLVIRGIFDSFEKLNEYLENTKTSQNFYKETGIIKGLEIGSLLTTIVKQRRKQNVSRS